LLVYSEGEGPPKYAFLEGDATKLIFDHLRNITLAAVVSQVGVIVLKLGATSWAYYIAGGYGSTLILLAFCFLLLNLVHGDHLLRHSPHFGMLRETRCFNVVEKVYWLLYNALGIPALMFKIVVAF
jgi:hypothetical protein